MRAERVGVGEGKDYYVHKSMMSIGLRLERNSKPDELWEQARIEEVNSFLYNYQSTRCSSR